VGLLSCVVGLVGVLRVGRADNGGSGSILPGDGYPTTPADLAVGIDHGPALRYNRRHGTFTDQNTGLQWEKKTPTGCLSTDVHCVDNLYTWSNTGMAPDGTLFTSFLKTLNTPPCFANHCDWRIPTVKELQSIVDYSKSNPAPTSVPGATAASNYWSSTSVAPFPDRAWGILFDFGFVGYGLKSFDFYARAVRSAQ